VHHSNHRPWFTDPLELFPRTLTKFYSIWVSLVYPFASKGRNLSVHFTSQLDRQRSVRISLGDAVSLRHNTWLNVATEDPTGDPIIVIDGHCTIGQGAMISAKNRIHLEKYVLVGQHVLIQDHNHAYEDVTRPIAAQGITEGGKVRIGEGCWIGRGSAIICARGQLTIGRHCVVAANSMVTQSIPDYSVVFGSPAKIIRQYDPEKRAWLMGQRRNSDLGILEAPPIPIAE